MLPIRELLLHEPAEEEALRTSAAGEPCLSLSSCSSENVYCPTRGKSSVCTEKEMDHRAIKKARVLELDVEEEPTTKL